ncbi:hypothetical protein MFLAVUS_001152 [Mucor flavus]|uniref:Uncharacterized protein n=1 Tax=Mucor flavus TaxID=439312 RepID=A0ABP9YLM9_9FUNG
MSLVQTLIQKSNPNIYIPNQLFPFVCVFIIAKTPAILLVGFVLGYMMIQPTSHTLLTDTPPKMIEAAAPVVNKPKSVAENKEEDIIIKSLILEKDLVKKPLLLEDNANSIEFENLMKFPSCPTTLPRLDTHFNFIIDHDIKGPDSTDIDWSAISQEMEYDQQRQDVANSVNVSISSSISSGSGSGINHSQLEKSEQQLPLISVQQQENLPVMFITNEKDNLFSLPDRATFEGHKGYGIAAHIPFHVNSTDAAILMVENESEAAAAATKKNSPLSIDIEDLLLFPFPPTPAKPSMSSPGQLFKSKFQKAVKKMKKTSNLMKNEDLDYKRSSTFSNTSNKRAASLQLNSYIPQDPLFNAPLSPRPSASARVHDHFKGRLNKLFKK